MDAKDVGYQDLVDQVTDGVYLVDRSRRILSWNKGAEAITGFARERVVDAFCFNDILRHIDAEGRSLCHGACPLAKTMHDGVSRNDVVFLHHREGHRLPVRVKTSPVRDGAGTIIGAVEVFNDATPDNALAARLEELKQAAMTDPLTELPNRRYLEMSLGSRLHELRAGGRPLGLLIMDIDRFKLVNDQHGHSVGDNVLRMVARTLRHAARATDDVGRWGGEEFVVLAACGGGELLEVAERFRTLVGASHLREREPIGVTISVGGAVGGPDDTPESLLRRADEQLYAAKAAGRDRVLVGSSDESP